MSQDDEKQSEEPVEITREYAEFYSGLVPHHSIIEGYQRAIPDGGKEVLAIVRRQQLFTFIVNMTNLLSNNLVPIVLVIPIMLAISAGAAVHITIAAGAPIGIYSVGGAFRVVVSALRGESTQPQQLLDEPARLTDRRQLPPQDDGA